MHTHTHTHMHTRFADKTDRPVALIEPKTQHQHGIIVRWRTNVQCNTFNTQCSHTFNHMRCKMFVQKSVLAVLYSTHASNSNITPAHGHALHQHHGLNSSSTLAFHVVLTSKKRKTTNIYQYHDNHTIDEYLINDVKIKTPNDIIKTF